MISIKIRKKIRTYKGYRELEVDAEFRMHTITKIYGPSGAGKTTLLKIIAGLITPEEGKITVDGEIWLDTAASVCLSPQKRKVGFVFQDYALFPNMTVQQHLFFATKNQLLIQKLLVLGRMEAFTKHKPEHLSGGQQQRLAILRALAIEPKVLLMDEPFSALDPDLRSVLIADIKQLLEEFKTTCLIVSHNPQEMEGLTNQSLKIDTVFDPEK